METDKDADMECPKVREEGYRLASDGNVISELSSSKDGDSHDSQQRAGDFFQSHDVEKETERRYGVLNVLQRQREGDKKRVKGDGRRARRNEARREMQAQRLKNALTRVGHQSEGMKTDMIGYDRRVEYC